MRSEGNFDGCPGFFRFSFPFWTRLHYSDSFLVASLAKGFFNFDVDGISPLIDVKGKAHISGEASCLSFFGNGNIVD